MCLNLGGVYELHLFDYNNNNACNDFSFKKKGEKKQPANFANVSQIKTKHRPKYHTCDMCYSPNQRQT